MIHSLEIKEITADLLKAQQEIKSVVKDAENKYYSSKYADLVSVMDACKKPLNKNNILVLQPVMGDVVETYLIHASGEWMKSETKIVCKEPNNPQAYGSAVTYARRYGLQSMVFIPAEDDDANLAAGNRQKRNDTSPAVVTGANSSIDVVLARCAHCHAIGKFHAPNCPNKETKLTNSPSNDL